MDFIRLNNKCIAYKANNAFFHKDKAILPNKKIPTYLYPHSILLNTPVFFYPNVALIVNPTSIKAAKAIASIIASEHNLYPLIFANKRLSTLLQKLYPKAAIHVTLCSKTPHIAKPLLKFALNIYTPPQLHDTLLELYPPPKNNYLF